MDNNQASIGSTAYDDETILWQGSPSQWLNFGKYFFYLLWWVVATGIVIVWHGRGYYFSYEEYHRYYLTVVYTLFAVPPVMALVHYLRIRSERIVITRNKITEKRGLTSVFRHERYCEISDITDIHSPPAGLLGLVGRATLILKTNDVDQPVISIRATKDREKLRKILQPLTRQLRQERKTYFSQRG
ncbi:hypothetical protein [Hahella ganghwensis]|uniref:hypothetical protein n=1 Tax=Hahella ganghwensis TaxID=286420 RepID=UPI0003611302|nr:hypothetical protein [Hahella ganghwensis]